MCNMLATLTAAAAAAAAAAAVAAEVAAVKELRRSNRYNTASVNGSQPSLQRLFSRLCAKRVRHAWLQNGESRKVRSAKGTFRVTMRYLICSASKVGLNRRAGLAVLHVLAGDSQYGGRQPVVRCLLERQNLLLVLVWRHCGLRVASIEPKQN
jgi:hypothetical protein